MSQFPGSYLRKEPLVLLRQCWKTHSTWMIHHAVLHAFPADELEVSAVAWAEHNIGFMAANVDSVSPLTCTSQESATQTGEHTKVDAQVWPRAY